jgi:redox-sensing transcriptional repressor
MSKEKVKKYPVPSVRRLPAYLRFLYELKAKDRAAVSCTHISDELRLDPTQVRKDLAITGIVGKPKIGYMVPELIDAIEKFLGWHDCSEAFLVGVGNLGGALLNYPDFKKHGLNIIAAFDIDNEKIGKTFQGKEIFPIEKFQNLASRMHVKIGIITVPPKHAQEIANIMIRADIKAIWNFAPATLNVPENVIVENVHLASSLAVLSSRLSELYK